MNDSYDFSGIQIRKEQFKVKEGISDWLAGWEVGKYGIYSVTVIFICVAGMANFDFIYKLYLKLSNIT